MELKTSLARAAACALVACGFSLPAHAQLDSILHALGQHVEQQATQKIENGMDRHINPSGAQAQQGASPMLRINGAYSFTPGPVTLFQQDFAATPVGAMPADIRTNGSGQVVAVNGLPGRWLELRDASIYKLAGGTSLPNHFTMTFDVVPAAHKIGDLEGYAFGFAPNNSLRDCGCGFSGSGINQIQLAYYGWIKVTSSATGYSRTNLQANFTGQENQVVHVAIAVNGNQMQVWLNHVKIADSQLFRRNPSRYFYFASGDTSSYGAKLLLGNLRIGGFAQTHGPHAAQAINLPR